MYRSRSFLIAGFLPFALAACSGGAGSPTISGVARQAQTDNAVAPAADERTIDAPLRMTPTTYALPLSGGTRVTVALHALGVPPGTRIMLGVREPQARAARAGCPSTLTIPLFNPFTFPIVLDVDNISVKLPCEVDGTLFGVSFYQLKPVPATVTSTKLGNITAQGRTIDFTPDVTTVTLPPRTETAISIVAEGSTSEVAIPIDPGSTEMLTSNASSVPSSLSMTYGSTGGGGSLYSSGCFPAFVSGTLATALQGIPIEGTPTQYCQLGTVNSPTVLFGSPSVTFTIGSPLPDRSFTELDGSPAEYLCSASGTTTCVTPAFTVPVVQNVIVGNVEDLQICSAVIEASDCNSNGNPGSPAPSATSLNANAEIEVLVADDPTYVAPPGSGACSAPQICGGFIVDTSSGSCLIDNNPDGNGDVPKDPPYNDPGGPQESPPLTSGSSNHAFFPKQGPYVEFDFFSGAAGTTCSVTVTEADGPLQRSVTLNLPVE